MLGFVAALGFVCSVHAHHGWGGYDTGRPLYLEGTVTQVDWRNPHPELVIEIAPPHRRRIPPTSLSRPIWKAWVSAMCSRKPRRPNMEGAIPSTSLRPGGWRIGA
ncbi:DUF6152 family protein [Sinorhizobium meliloti]|uniref:DUF6152 family protein n=1 Tax=Rhizobium meliloti TaxID=382 RepID=UPI003C6FAF1E